MFVCRFFLTNSERGSILVSFCGKTRTAPPFYVIDSYSIFDFTKHYFQRNRSDLKNNLRLLKESTKILNYSPITFVLSIKLPKHHFTTNLQKLHFRYAFFYVFFSV